MKEAIYTRALNPSLNRDGGSGRWNLPPIWDIFKERAKADRPRRRKRRRVEGGGGTGGVGEGRERERGGRFHHHAQHPQWVWQRCDERLMKLTGVSDSFLFASWYFTLWSKFNVLWEFIFPSLLPFCHFSSCSCLYLSSFLLCSIVLFFVCFGSLKTEKKE